MCKAHVSPTSGTPHHRNLTYKMRTNQIDKEQLTMISNYMSNICQSPTRDSLVLKPVNCVQEKLAEFGVFIVVRVGQNGSQFVVLLLQRTKEAVIKF